MDRKMGRVSHEDASVTSEVLKLVNSVIESTHSEKRKKKIKHLNLDYHRYLAENHALYLLNLKEERTKISCMNVVNNLESLLRSQKHFKLYSDWLK